MTTRPGGATLRALRDALETMKDLVASQDASDRDEATHDAVS